MNTESNCARDTGYRIERHRYRERQNCARDTGYRIKIQDKERQREIKCN